MTTPTPLWSNHRIASKLLDKVEAGMDIESASGQLVREMRDDYAAALAARDAEIASLKAQVSELEAHIVIDRGVYNRLCTLQAIMSHPTATPTTEEFDEYCGLLELVFHKHEKDGDE